MENGDLPRFQRSIDTQRVIEVLEKAEVGELITYETLTRAINRDVRGSAKGNLDTARKVLERSRIYFDIVRRKGLMRICENDHVSRVKDVHLNRARNNARRGLKRLEPVVYEELDRTAQATFNTSASVFSLFSHVTKPRQQRLLEDACNSEQLTIGNTLDLFKK